MTPRAIRAEFEKLLEALLRACRTIYAERLVSVVVFGSVGRGTPRPDSDIDVLIVARPLPDGRMPRVAEFAAVERALAPDLAECRAAGVRSELSPVFKTPVELARHSPLLLDLVDDARVLLDNRGVFATAIAGLRARLDQLGARRIWRGNAWFWDLKPDYRPGEVFEL